MGNQSSSEVQQNMEDANKTIQSIPVVGNFFKLQDSATDSFSNAMEGVGGILKQPNMILYIGGGVLLIMLIK